MSTSNLRIVASKIPKASMKGLAYLASANFLARAIILVRHYIVTAFHSEMILIYGATLDTRILLFFQAIYMIPMFLLGILVFYGIDRESFNLVLYPTLMLIFLILIRYGSEAALLAVHWEDHKFDQTPELVFTLIQDIIFIGILLFYVYVCLAFTPIKPTPLQLVEVGNPAFATAAQGTNLIPQIPVVPNPSSDQLAPVPIQLQIHAHHPAAAVGPDSQGFNYSSRRNVDQIPKETPVENKPLMLDDVVQLIVKEKCSSIGEGVVSTNTAGSLIETDLDAVVAVPTASTVAAVIEDPVKPSTSAAIEDPVKPSTSAAIEDPVKPSTSVAPATEESAVTVKLNKSRIAAARKKLAETQKEPEKPAEPEVDFWGTSNGDPPTETASKTDSFKTTAV